MPTPKNMVLVAHDPTGFLFDFFADRIDPLVVDPYALGGGLIGDLLPEGLAIDIREPGDRQAYKRTD